MKKILATRWLDHALSCEVEKLLAQPEQTEQEPVAHCRVFPLKGNESTPQVGIIWVDKPITGALYTSPPKREPLSDAEIFNAWIPSKATPCVHSFKAGVKFAEKDHGIGGGE